MSSAKALTVVNDTNALLMGRIQEALNRGLSHQQAKQYREAVAAYDQVLAINPENLAALVNKGVALRQLHRPAEAMACYWLAVAAAPESLEAWCNAGNALGDLGRNEEARAVLKVVLQRAPKTAEAWLALGIGLSGHRQLAAAEACLRRAGALAPNNVAARLRLAALLNETGAAKAALEQFLALLELFPEEPAVHSGLGQALVSLGRLDEAEAPLCRSLELQADHLDGHLGLARLCLLKGDLTSGWSEYEWRRHKNEGKFPKLSGTEWDGSDPRGKTILVYAEQGFGDTLQFIRYLPLLAQRGARVVVVCQVSMLKLIQAMPGVASAQAVWRPLPAYDYWTPLLSLPLRMGPVAEDLVHRVPYLKPPRQGAILPAPMGSRLKVGLVWAGSPTHPNDSSRSLALTDLLPVTGIHGVTVYSLQKGPRASDLRGVAHPALITDLSSVLGDFADTADIVAGLDLLVTVDTAVAHLAGALGKPVWVLLPCDPDWRWQLERSDSPWYPTMTLFRQSEPGEWGPVVEQIVRGLQNEVSTRAIPAALPDIQLNSVFGRFHMTAPRGLLSDPGIRFLVGKERAGIGYEYATRSFLDAHLRPEDLFIDVGAHWGIMTLQAVSRWPGQIHALAIEPLPGNLPYLHRWVSDNDVGDCVEIIAAAAADRPGQGRLRPESTMGHSLIKERAGPVTVVSIDQLLAERPQFVERRVIVKIDVEGSEVDVVKGMDRLLRSGRVAAVIWEYGVEYHKPEGQKRLKALLAKFTELKFTAWCFESEDDAGPLAPFGKEVPPGWRGNVFQLAEGIEPRTDYGHPRPTPVAQPEDHKLDGALRARHLFVRSMGLPQQGKIKEAMALLTEAAAIDSTISELYNNMGVILRGTGRHAAAAACYRRALSLTPDDTGVMSNLGNVLRELGRLCEASALQAKALELQPNDSGLIYNAAIVHRDAGRPDDALALLDRSLDLHPGNNDCRWDRALVLLQSGDYARGFPAYEARWNLPRARSRRWPLPAWDGAPLDGRNIFLTDEQGFGDLLQFARFIPELKARGAGKVVLECQPELLRLMALAPGVDAALPRDRAVPACDVTAPVLSLPGLFGTTLESLPKKTSYLVAPEPACVLPSDGRFKLGLVWAGKTTPRDRSIPLERLLPLLGDPRIAAFSLQVGPRAADLKSSGADAFVTDLAASLFDFAETAAVLKQLDLLITIDTAVAHLAGALGVPTFVLLRYTSDWRWFDKGADSPWYPSLTLFRQHAPDRWEVAVDTLKAAMAEAVEHFDRTRTNDPKNLVGEGGNGNGQRSCAGR